MKIYPGPLKFADTDDKFVFSGDIEIKYNEDFPYSRTLEVLKDFWNSFTNGKSNIKFERDSSLVLHAFSCNNVKSVCENGFEYSLSVTQNGFGICGENWIGLVHGMFSLLQLIQPERIDNENLDKFRMSVCEISDKPAIAMRSFHYAFHPVEIKKLQEILRMCAFMKYTHIIVEFYASIVFDAIKEMAAGGNLKQFTYTKEELKPYFEEAKALGVEFIPMFNHRTCTAFGCSCSRSYCIGTKPCS